MKYRPHGVIPDVHSVHCIANKLSNSLMEDTHPSNLVDTTSETNCLFTIEADLMKICPNIQHC